MRDERRADKAGNMTWAELELAAMKARVSAALPEGDGEFLAYLQATHGPCFNTAPLSWWERAKLNRIMGEVNAREASRWN